MASVKNKTFTLSETEDKNQLLFYRNDGEVLEGDLKDFEGKVLYLYESYVACKMMTGEIPGSFDFELDSEMSDDNKCIRLTFSERNEKKPNIFKRLINKIFG